MTNNWRPLPGVTRVPFASIPVGNGYWPPIWFRRWGRTVFTFGGWAIAAILIFWRIV